MATAERQNRRLTTFQSIILGFAGVILIGTVLLMLPVSSQSGTAAPFGDALFTATSAVCVTGLVVRDTASCWSGFGQAVILAMIQIGGLGVVTVAASFALLSGRKISLLQRSAMQEAITAPKMGGIVRLTGFILKMTFLFEAAGALALTPGFCKEYGIRGVWMAVFHSVSAFCNAGFDVMGTKDAPFASLTSYAGQPALNTAVMLLIVIGGIGFLTWEDVRTNQFRFSRYRMQSKVILVTSAVLIVAPAVFFFFAEFKRLPMGERILASLFQAVTPRTAGFNTADLTAMSGAGKAVIVGLMLIGGSPGSTAGGMKTTTAAVLIANAVTVFRRKEDAHFFGRRLESGAVRNASTILLLYLVLFVSGGIVISLAEGLPVGACLFEAASAIGTVGLSMGITPALGAVSRTVLILLMFFGRVGGLTLIYAALSGTKRVSYKLPQERITVG